MNTKDGAIALTGTGAGGPDGPEPASGLDQRRSSPIASHTPGPWQNQEGFNTIFTCTNGTVGTTIALAKAMDHQVAGGTAEATANARLIAAAPELLEALEFYANGIGFTEIEDGGEVARAAIAKAQGETA